jgi:hypothetical protein
MTERWLLWMDTRGWDVAMWSLGAVVKRFTSVALAICCHSLGALVVDLWPAQPCASGW